MLRVANVGRDNLGYYFDPALVDAECGDADGVYIGGLSATLGLSALAADEATLPALLDGVDPTTGELLDAKHRRVRVLAYDCTFAAPKSVSLLALLDDEDEAVIGAHRRSVASAFEYLEREAGLVRRSGPRGVESEPAAGLAAAAFVHRTNRNDDPHLHTHLLVANLAADRRGQYSALDGRALYEQVSTAGSLYRCQLRHELSTNLGLYWRRDPRGFNDLSGLSRRAVEAFSTRAGEIAEALAQTGQSGSGARDVAAHRTRLEKNRSVHRAEVAARWHDRRLQAGIATSELRALRTPGRRPPPPDPVAAIQERADALPGSFGRAELLRESSSVLADGAPIGLLERAVDDLLESSAVTRLADRGERRGAERQIPPARLSPRYVTVETAALQAENAARLAGARELSPNAVLGPGLYRAADFASVAELGVAVRPLVGIARAATTAAHLEALTGVECGTAASLSRPSRHAVLVVFGPEQLSAKVLQPLLARAADQPVVVLDRMAPLGGRPNERPSLHLESVDGVALYRAPTPAAAVQSAEALALALETEGRRPVLVSAEPGVFSRPSVLPHRVRDALAAADGSVAVVLGGGRLLGAGLSMVADDRRVHVVVARGRAAIEADRAALVELVSPRAPRRGTDRALAERDGRSGGATAGRERGGIELGR